MISQGLKLHELLLIVHQIKISVYLDSRYSKTHIISIKYSFGHYPSIYEQVFQFLSSLLMSTIKHGNFIKVQQIQFRITCSYNNKSTNMADSQYER